MDKLTLAAILVDDGEGRAGDTVCQPHASRHTADKGGLARAEVAVHGNDRSVGKVFCKLLADSLGLRLAAAYECLHLPHLEKVVF